VSLFYIYKDKNYKLAQRYELYVQVAKTILSQPSLRSLVNVVLATQI